MNDLRFAIRQLMKHPGFTAAAVLTLALGIGANTAIFGFVSAILIRPLPFKNPGQLVAIYESYAPSGERKVAVAPPVFSEWRKQSTLFEGLAARAFRAYILTGRGDSEGLTAGQLSVNIFPLLGVRPVLGRNFLPEEETFGKHRVVLLSHELWERRFGSNKDVIGQRITLSDEQYTVIGIMPPRTFFPDRDTELWTPLAFEPDEAGNRHSHNYAVFGRLKPGATLAQGQLELDLISRRITAVDEQNKGWSAEVYHLQDVVVGDSKRVLLILLVSAAAVLLIGCANVANLLLARSAGRSREFAIRVALGARRSQLIRQLLTESVLLAALGATAGLLVAAFGLPVLVRMSPPDLPRIWEGIQLDGRTLAFTTFITLATVAIFGLAPALQSAKSTPAESLSDSSRGTSAGPRPQHFRKALVVAEVAMSLMLLVAAGLVLRSFSRILSQPLGYNPEQVVSFDIGLTAKKYDQPGASALFFDELLKKIRATPGLNSAGLVAGLPLAHWDANVGVSVDGAAPRSPEEASSAQYAQISPGYFGMMGIAMLQGRDFNEWDRATTAPVVIVNEAFIKDFKLGNEVLGRRLTLGEGTKSAEIVGIVHAIKRTDLSGPAHSEIYRPFQQACWGQMRLIVRTSQERGEATRLVRARLDGIDQTVPILNVRSMADLLDSSVAQRRLVVRVLSGFATVALLLASIGLYGVIAHHVTQRTQEIGIRIALGAQRDRVMRLILHDGMKLAAIGVAVGLMGAVALTGLLRKLLYEIAPTDPVTFVAITLLLIVISFLASWFPARRAAKIDPIVALRHE